VLAAIGFWLWAKQMTSLSLSAQIWFIIMAGAGMGLMLGQASTDALNRADQSSYGEAAGITQKFATMLPASASRFSAPCWSCGSARLSPHR